MSMGPQSRPLPTEREIERMAALRMEFGVALAKSANELSKHLARKHRLERDDAQFTMGHSMIDNGIIAQTKGLLEEHEAVQLTLEIHALVKNRLRAKFNSPRPTL